MNRNAIELNDAQDEIDGLNFKILELKTKLKETENDLEKLSDKYLMLLEDLENKK